MQKLISLGRAWLRKTWRNNQSVDVSLSGPKFKIDFNRKDEPIETRAGLSAKGRKPFYESSASPLLGYYFGYQKSTDVARGLLYADIIPLKSGKMHGLSLEALAVDDIRVKIEPVAFRLPSKLRDHQQAALNIFKELKKLNFNPESQEWENDIALRINSIKADGTISCSKARYFDQIATNLTLDWASGELPDGARTIRSGIERPVNGLLPRLEDSVLANTLGIAVMFYNERLEPIVRTRSASLASIEKQALHCTVSGVLEIESGQQPGIFDFSIFTKGAAREIFLEMGLSEGDYALYPVAFARELPRGGKPQLFFAAVSLIPEQELRTKLASAREAHEYVNDDKSLDADMTKYSQSKDDEFTYEGWACLYLAEGFVQANEGPLRELIDTHDSHHKQA